MCVCTYVGRCVQAPNLVASFLCRTHFKVPALPLMKPGKGKKKKNKALHNGGGNSQS